MLFSDNGASAEGGVHGSVNEHRFSSAIPESLEDNLAHYDDWGGPATYNHYAWGWAWPATRRSACGSATPGSAARVPR
ncbi:hypothetical protein ACFQ0B_37595 [Nonomuraea thailandensis]